MNFAHVADRVFNRPHLVEPGYARIMIGALADRLDVETLRTPDNLEFDAADLRSAAAGFERKAGGIVEQVAGIAVIPVTGTLVHRFGHLDPRSGMTGYDGIQAKIESALEDPNIRGILLDIDSPGGEVSGCFDLADFIADSREDKPIWAVADELCASAAYAIGSSAERLIMPRTGQAGSIGVVFAHTDHSKRLEKAGVNVTLIYAGEHKADANQYEPLPDSVRKELQAEIDHLYSDLVATVARNRGMRESAVRNTEARVYIGDKAVRAGLVDEVMPAHDVLSAFDEHLNGNTRARATAGGQSSARPRLEDFAARYWSQQTGKTA